jgi:hypothetical protein
MITITQAKFDRVITGLFYLSLKILFILITDGYIQGTGRMKKYV